MVGRFGRAVAWLAFVALPVGLTLAKAPDTCPGPHHKQHTSTDPPVPLHEHLASRYEDPGLDAKQYASATASHPHARPCDPRALVGRPRCGKLDFIKSNLTGHIYYSELTKHYFYEPDECLLRRLRSGQAASCLAQQAPLVFVGDSVTRYQYLAFIHWLVAGKYQHPYNGNGSFTDAKKLHDNPHDPAVPAWNQVWQRVQQQLLGRAQQRRQQVTFSVVQNRSAHVERARFTLDDKGTGKQVRVYYYYTSCIDKRSVQGAVGWALQQERNVTLLLASCAHYGDQCGKDRLRVAADAKQSFPLLRDMVKGRGRVIWKACATVERGVVAKAEGQVQQLAAKLGIPTYNVRALVNAAMDQELLVTWRKGEICHFMQWVYADLNDVLLNILC